MAASSKITFQMITLVSFGKPAQSSSQRGGEDDGDRRDDVYEQLNIYLWLAVFHCDTESSSTTVWLSHLFASFGAPLSFPLPTLLSFSFSLF